MKFPRTEWTQIKSALTSGGSIDPKRIEILCSAYYAPIAGFIRSICPRQDDAEDFTQGFMAELAQGKYLSSVDPEAGRFRSFLCRCAQNFARSQWRKRAAQKRGGDADHLPFDEASTDATTEPAIAEFDRAWVGVVVERTLKILHDEYAHHNTSADFDLLVEGLGWSGNVRPAADLAEQCGLTKNAFGTAVHRLKRRFGEHLRNEVRSVVATEDDVEEELRYYLKLFPE